MYTTKWRWCTRRVYTFARVHMSNVDKSSRSVFYFNYDFSNYSVSNHPIILKADKNRYRHQIFLKFIALLGFPFKFIIFFIFIVLVFPLDSSSSCSTYFVNWIFDSYFVLRILTSVHHKPHIYRYLTKRSQLYLFYRNFIAVFPNHCSLIHFLCCTKIAKNSFELSTNIFIKLSVAVLEGLWVLLKFMKWLLMIMIS